MIRKKRYTPRPGPHVASSSQQVHFVSLHLEPKSVKLEKVCNEKIKKKKNCLNASRRILRRLIKERWKGKIKSKFSVFLC